MIQMVSIRESDDLVPTMTIHIALYFHGGLLRFQCSSQFSGVDWSQIGPHPVLQETNDSEVSTHDNQGRLMATAD